MDAPKGRYSVVEKGGRLVVIDNESGAPASPVLPAPPAKGPAASGAPIVAGKSPLEAASDLMLGLVAHSWDEQGRALIRWEWKEKGKTRRWHAALDARQQQRLGHALLALLLAPLFVLILIVSGGDWFLPAVILIAPPVLWGALVVAKLQSDTAGQDPGQA